MSFKECVEKATELFEKQLVSQEEIELNRIEDAHRKIGKAYKIRTDIEKLTIALIAIAIFIKGEVNE